MTTSDLVLGWGLRWDGLRMSVREPDSLSRANGAYLVVDHFLRGLSLKNQKKKLDVGLRGWCTGFGVQGSGFKS